MRQVEAAEAEILFNDFFAHAKKIMFKAEVLQDYSAVDSSLSLHTWLGGQYAESKELARHDQNIIAWQNRCLASPAHIKRVHAVDYPLTPYLEWELEVIYKDSLLKYGAEEVYLIEKKSIQNWPAGDFWIFDDEKVLEWQYDTSGKIVAAYISKKPDDVQPYLRLRDQILTNLHLKPV